MKARHLKLEREILSRQVVPHTDPSWEIPTAENVLRSRFPWLCLYFMVLLPKFTVANQVFTWDFLDSLRFTAGAARGAGALSSREELPRIRGQEQRLCVAGTAVKRYPTFKVRETPLRWLALREGIRGQPKGNHNHRKLANLITWTTALSNSVKLSHAEKGHPRWTGHGGKFWQNVAHWRREWQTTSVCLPWEPHEQHDKAKI